MIDQLKHTFEEQFSSLPSFAIRAPGRINLIGEHIDYLDGFVMPAAIDRSIFAVGAANQTDKIRLLSSLSDEVTSFSVNDDQIRKGKDFWLNYVVGVLASYRKKGIPCKGFDLVIDTDLPTGAGLSSSAALETTFALAVEKMADTQLTPVERARLCLQAEHEYAGVPCGIMDQLAVGASEAGKGLLIDCQSQEFDTVSIPDGVSIIVTDTQVKHALGDGEYKKRCEDCAAALSQLGVDSWRDVTMSMIEEKQQDLGDRLFRRARHAVTEIGRVGAFADALQQNNSEQIGKLMKASHLSLKDDYEVSCPELDLLVDAAYEFGPKNGLLGSRMTGGGFGGSAICLVTETAADKLMQHLQTKFCEAFNREVTPFITTPSAGAHYVEL